MMSDFACLVAQSDCGAGNVLFKQQVVFFCKYTFLKKYLSGGFSAGRVVKSAFSTAARKSAGNKGPAGCCFDAAPYETLLKRDGGRPWQLGPPRLSAGRKRAAGSLRHVPDRQQIIKLPFKNNADNSQRSSCFPSDASDLIDLEPTLTCRLR